MMGALLPREEAESAAIGEERATEGLMEIRTEPPKVGRALLSKDNAGS